MNRSFTYAFILRSFYLLLFVTSSLFSLGQGATCATATLLPTNTTASCATYTSTAATGSSVCTGGGFGGGGFLSWFRFCTDANASCIELDLTPGTLTGAYNYALYATCGGGLVPGQLGANNCFGAGGPSTWRTTGLNLAANTCYYLAIWTKNAGTFQICSKKITPPPNDECNGATQITSAPAAANNFCYTPNPADPPPSTFCAASNENSSWFVFTAQCAGSVTLNITNITCSGGAGGFQIGFYTGSCNNLTNIGCNTGTGGTVTTTVTNLTAGQTIYILVDGNAGSQCTFNVSATNTTPDISPPVTICSGESTTLTAYGGTTYQWSNGATTPSITVSPTSTTTYSVVINNCTATTLNTTVTVNQPVTPQFTQVGPVCPGGTFTLPTTSNNGVTGTWSPAINTNATTTYTFTPTAGQCANTASMTVQVTNGTVPAFTQVGPICRGQSFTLPTTSNNGITGTWSPAINTTATTTYTFTPASNSCAVSTTMTVTVNTPVTPAFTQIPSFCSGGTFTLPSTSNNGINGSWSPAINNTATTTYTFTPSAGQCATTASMTVTIQQPVTPTFTQVAPLCTGGSFNLPGTSNNNISGTWSPAINNTATTTYTFTPTVGQCATTASMIVTIQQPVAPSFPQIGPICSGSALALPNTSTNGIPGTWSPSINNTATTTYTFTPAAGQCATTASITVQVTSLTTPAFTQIGPFCQGQSFTLPSTSSNGINGTWAPAINTNTTTTYTFTPSAGQCATTASMTVTINAATVPAFAQVPAICSGSSFNLPNTSDNGVTGTWLPLLNFNATTTYTFTPSVGQCATTASMTVTVQQPVVPIFTQLAPICAGGTFILPSTSNNGISGVWLPAINNTATTTYTFTPAPNTCATNTVMSVTVNQPITPTFTQVAPICTGGSFSLPATSNNGITGVWSPAIDNNSTTTYTFTPNGGQCANTATMTVTVNPPTVVPAFTQVAPICQGQSFTLPSISNNGISGSWSPAINTNSTTQYTFTPAANSCALPATMTVTVNTPVASLFAQVPAICLGGSFTLPAISTNGIAGNWSPAINNTATTTYTFTPTAGQCALTASMTVTVNQPVTPTFPSYGPYCQNAIIPQVMLPNTSNNGIDGTWNPGMISTAVAGNINYTFTPSAGECAVPVVITILVNAPLNPQFAQVAPLCRGSNFSLPSNSINGVIGSWSPAIDNTVTTTYTFTPSGNQCANTAQMTVTINQPAVPAFTQVPAICLGGTFSLPSVSNDGYTGIWSPAVDNTVTTTYTFTPSSGNCVTTAQMTVGVNPPSTVPVFNQLAPVCQGQSFTLPTVSTNGISGSWLPAPNSNATTQYTFTPAANSCALPTTMTVNVDVPVASLFTQVPAICSGGSFTLPATSTNGITGNWSPAINNTATTTYTFTPTAGQCALTASMTVTVNQPVTPVFSSYGPYCQNENIAQPMLPGTSNNGIAGNWNPAMISTAVAGTGTYIFTPSAGECAVTGFLNIVVNAPVIPQFTQVGPLCSGTNFSLPFNSNNAITGIWSPAINNTVTTTYTFTPTLGLCATTMQMTVVINQPTVPAFTQVPAICTGGSFTLTSVSNDGFNGAWTPAINNTTTTTYTFTPSSGNCVTTAQMTVTVNPPSTVPLFSQAGPVCQGQSFTLPLVSNNGISGNWLPAPNSNATTQYTFTPDPNSCALPVTMTVTVDVPVASLFTQVPAICSGGSFVLPATSNNGIIGSWSPAIDNTVTTSYSFTPAAGQCASTASMTVNVNQPVNPVFSSYGPYCQNENIVQPMLPGTSNNGITGSWNPGMISTANSGNFTYTFTPAAGECAISSAIDVVVNAPVVPQFAQVGPYCRGTSFTLPFNSLNAITGVWSPLLNDTATITYTFTPSLGLCATTSQMTVVINQPVDPLFTQLPAVCTGGSIVLPSTSNNGIGGSWSPAVNNNQTTTYTFTPASGQCANTAAMTVQVNSPVTPQFAPIGSICAGSSFTLPAVSLDGISGNWNPPVNNTATTTYSFTPDPGQCANSSATMTVTVSNNIVPSFAPVNAICAGEPLAALPVTSLNGINGGWSPALNNNTTTTYTFTPGAGQCSNTPVNLIIVVNPIPQPPVLAATQPTCTTLGALSITGNAGFTYSINGGAFSPNLNYGSLPGNTYQVVAQSPENCISSAASVVINTPPPVPPAPVVNVTLAGCTTPSLISITAAPGELYSFDNGPFNNTLVYSSPSVGSHSIIAQNSSGCVSAATAVSVDPAPAIPSAPVLSVQQPTCTTPGSFVINAVAGETYSVDGGAFTTVYTFNPASPGNHTVIAQNQAGCVSAASIINILPSPPVPLAPVLNVTQPTCTTPGSLAITGVPGETYSIDGGPFTPVLNYSSVAPGNHTVIAQNASGCLSPASPFVIVNPPGIPQTPVLNVTQPDCTNPAGAFLISGVAGENYSVNGGPFVPNLNYPGLNAGNYTVVAQNTSGCISAAATVIIQQAPSIPSVPAVAVVQPGCTVPSSITITGIPGETYSVNGAAYSSTLVYNSVAAGSYSIIAQNASGCFSAPANVIVNQAPGIPAAPSVNPVQAGCSTPASFTINGVGGELYSVNGSAFSSTLSYNPIAPGSYSIVAQNASGCLSAATNISINQPPNIPSAPVANAVQPTCTLSTGSFIISPAAGETYSVNGSPFGNTTAYSTLAPGAYQVIAQNASGCNSPATNVIINNPPPIPAVPQLSATHPGCRGTTGSVTITGQPGETYSVDGGQYSSVLNVGSLAPGNHTVVAQNSFGCISPVGNIIINDPPPIPNIPQASAVQPGCTTPGSIQISGLAGLQYSVDGGPFSTSLNYSPMATGSHSVVAQNSFGCVSDPLTLAIIASPGIPATPLVNVTQPTCSVPTGAFSINGVTGETYSVNGGGFNSTLNYPNSNPGNYSIIASNASGCLSAPANIVINPAPVVPPAPAVSSPLSYCQGTSIPPLTAGGIGQLLWYNSASGGVGSSSAPVPSSSVPGTSIYYVSQLSGPCEGPRSMITVRVNERPELGNPANVEICNDATLNLNSLYGPGAAWFYGQVRVATPSSVNQPGLYSIIATNSFGCSDTNTVNLIVRPPLIADAGPDDSVQIMAPYQLNGSGSISYTWTPSQPLNNPNVFNPIARIKEDTRFVLMVQDDKGCRAFDSMWLRVIYAENVFVPTAFSPNGDGLNDIFRPAPLGGIKELDYFRVFNRFGELIFETKDITDGWDGTYKGRKQDVANYVWVLKGKNKYGVVKFLRGNVVLIR